MELISSYDKIIARLKEEGRVTQIVWTSEQEMNWINKMIEFRRESNYKQALSEIELSKIYLTA